eukprot:scaffold7363_cov263-Pinguiococcus_pyrenoidosus.AAC.21
MFHGSASSAVASVGQYGEASGLPLPWLLQEVSSAAGLLPSPTKKTRQPPLSPPWRLWSAAMAGRVAGFHSRERADTGIDESRCRGALPTSSRPWATRSICTESSQLDHAAKPLHHGRRTHRLDGVPLEIVQELLRTPGVVNVLPAENLPNLDAVPHVLREEDFGADVRNQVRRVPAKEARVPMLCGYDKVNTAQKQTTLTWRVRLRQLTARVQEAGLVEMTVEQERIRAPWKEEPGHGDASHVDPLQQRRHEVTVVVDTNGPGGGARKDKVARRVKIVMPPERSNGREDVVEAGEVQREGARPLFVGSRPGVAAAVPACQSVTFRVLRFHISCSDKGKRSREYVLEIDMVPVMVGVPLVPRHHIVLVPHHRLPPSGAPLSGGVTKAQLATCASRDPCTWSPFSLASQST